MYCAVRHTRYATPTLRRRRDATLWRESNNSLRRKRHMLSGTVAIVFVVDAAVITVTAARRWHSPTDRRPSFTFSNNNL